MIIPDSVNRINVNAFEFCSSLTNITIPKGVTNIESGVFHACENCLIFDFRKATSVIALDDTFAFYNTPSNKEIIVPDSLYDTWIAATNWCNIKTSIVKASQSSLGPL